MPKDEPAGRYAGNRGATRGHVAETKKFEKDVNDLREYAYKLQSRFHKPGEFLS